MSMSNYPNGFTRGVILRGVPITQTQPGQVFWVYNGAALSAGQRGGSDGNAGTFDSPFATLNYAITRCTANRGDIIFIKPGHAETISTATAMTLGVAGVAVVGLGAGLLRPTFTLDTLIGATINVTAANISLKNVIISANFDDITAAITTTTATDFALEHCFIKSTAVNKNFLNVITTSATTSATDGLYVVGNTWIEPDTATLGMVTMAGTNARVNISENYVQVGVNNNKATLLAIATGKLVTNLRCNDNQVFRLNTDTATGGLLITTDGTTNSGVICRNLCQHADTAAEILVTASSGFGFFLNYASGVAGASGYLLPAADS